MSYRRTVPKEVRVTVDLKSLARLGAQVRLAELIAEVDAVLAAFPELGQAPTRPAEAKPATRKRRRPTMTAEQKKVVSIRMKKYWAGRRQAKKG